MNESYVYIEPEERAKRRNEIRSTQVPIEDLQRLVSEGATEQEIQKVIKKDLSFLADVFAYREEYICLSEYVIGDDIVDFIVLTSRSRMQVCLIEIKGADFCTAKNSHYEGMNAHIHDAVGQINNHIRYINRNYSSFREQIHKTREDVISGRYKSNYLLGPKGELLVDPDKDIKLRNIVIGGSVRDDCKDSRERTEFEEGMQGRIEVYSWESFIRRLDEQHGHYFD